MNSSFEGQYAVVTGGSRGIGAAVAAALIQQGAQVTIMGRSLESVQSKANEIGAQAVVVDVTLPDSVAGAFAKAQSCGEITILINNAGSAESASFQRTDLELWQRMLNINLTGTFLCSKAVVPGMIERGYGRIINIASTAALTGYPYVAAYCAAKHGVMGLTRALAAELVNKNITVNAICPGYTDTDLVAEAVANIVQKTERTAKEALAGLLRNNPQGRLIQPK